MASLQNIAPGERSLQRIVNVLRGVVTFNTGILVSRGHILGTATSDQPAAGEIGQVIFANAGANTVPITTGTPLTICTLVVPPGDWMLFGVVSFTPAATTSITRAQSSISDTTNALTTGQNALHALSWPAFVPNSIIYSRVGPRHIQVAAGATLNQFLVAEMDFTVSTVNAGANLQALRIR